MSRADGRQQDEKATVARELFLLGQKTVEARAVLAALKRELSDANTQLADSQQLEQLLEANQQLVLAILAQSDAQQPVQTPEELRLLLEMREANEQLVIAALGAQDLQAAAEQALARQRNALTQVAHELRSPLAPIGIIAGRLQRIPSEELPRMQALIEGQVQHMSRLIDDLLDVSRSSTGKLRLDRSLVDMQQLIQRAIDVCRPAMAARHLDFSWTLPACELKVDGDPVRLTQVLGNLLGNAAKYTPQGGSVSLAASADGDMLTIRICDSGIGISAQALPFVFEPFMQDIHAVDFNGTGLGIGLTVVRELVNAHGGTVAGTSEGNGKGSQFVVTLPLAGR